MDVSYEPTQSDDGTHRVFHIMEVPEPSKLCYWEPVSSTVDWCERNCVYSQYIAEFFNSISNLGLLIPSIIGLLGVIRCQGGRVEKRFILLYGCQIIVAIGSLLFHATLTKLGQFLDEFSMILTGLLFFYVSLEIYPKIRYPYLPYMLVLYGCGIVTTAIFNIAPIFFQGSFGCLLALVLYQTHRLGSSSKESNNVRNLYILGMALWIVGIACWMIDYHGCKVLEKLPFRDFFQLHAWWHILTGLGSYSASVFFSYQRISRKHGGVRVGFYMGFPYLECMNPKEVSKSYLSAK